MVKTSNRGYDEIDIHVTLVCSNGVIGYCHGAIFHQAEKKLPPVFLLVRVIVKVLQRHLEAESWDGLDFF